MEMEKIVRNPVFNSAPSAFSLRDVINQPGVEGFKRCKRPIVYHENGDTEFNLYYSYDENIESVSIQIMTTNFAQMAKALPETQKTGRRPALMPPIPMEKTADHWWTVTVPGIEPGAHVFQTWRRALIDFAPRLFV